MIVFKKWILVEMICMQKQKLMIKRVGSNFLFLLSCSLKAIHFVPRISARKTTTISTCLCFCGCLPCGRQSGVCSPPDFGRTIPNPQKQS